MRVFNQYKFTVGNTEFHKIFSLVDEFLRQQDLHYDKLCCEVRDSDRDQSMRTRIAKGMRIIPNRKSAVVYGLKTLMQDHPDYFNCGKYQQIEVDPHFRDELVWSDMDAYGEPIGSGEQTDITALATLFPVPYCLSSVLFSYVNIDFFGRKIEPISERSDKSEYARMNRLGSHISFTKETVFNRAPKLVMTIEVTDGNGVYDSTRYAKSLSDILGKKFETNTEILFSEEERLEIESRKENAKYLVEAANAAFAEEGKRIVQPKGHKQDTFKAGKNLKKIAKAYGFYSYLYDPINIYYLSTGIGDGHTLTLVVDVPPHFHEIRLSARLTGLGFHYSLPLTEFYCDSQETADHMLKTAFEIVRKMEEPYFIPILEQFRQTPDWFAPYVK